MKKYILVCLVVACAFMVRAQSGTVNFAPGMCIEGSGNDYTYTYENYYYSHGGGYTILRNGEPIHSQGGDGVTSSSATCKGLYFINESTGFLHIYGNWTYNSLYKTTDYGETWTFFAGSGPSGDFYIVNEHYVYTVILWGTETRIASKNEFETYSDIVIQDTTLTDDIYAFDTIPGPTLCGVDFLKVDAARNGETITYWINFIYGAATGINENATSKNLLSVYPNPASNNFKLAMPGEPVTAVTLYSAVGQQVKQFTKAEMENNTFGVENLANGIYYLDIQLKTTTRKAKVYIQN